LKTKTAALRTVIAATAILMFSCAGYGPKHMSSREFTALKRADAALRTLNDHRLDSIFVYGPLLAQAETAVSEISAVAKNEEDRNAFYVAKKCVNAIAESRQNYQDHHDDDLRVLDAKIIASSIGDVDAYIRTPSEITAP
jgi:hypothetical protein